MPIKEKVFITVKTYPIPSKTYGELVCTAGIKEDGSWVRIYPYPFRRMEDYQKFKKYSWIEVELEKNSKDFRPESYRPCNKENIKIIENIGTGRKKDWAERNSILFKYTKVYNNIDELVAKAKDNELSLALFKPAKILDFHYEKVERIWDEDTLKIIKETLSQGDLFDPDKFLEDFKVTRKLPYKFSYKFSDEKGKISKPMIADWEIGELYWHCLKNGNEKDAVLKVRDKYFDQFIAEKDLYFFLGTTKEFHNIAPNPFIIIGVYYPPKKNQTELNLI